MHLRCYRCNAWQHAVPRDVPPVGSDVWCCCVCKADQHPRDGALAWQLWEWQRSKSPTLRRWAAKNSNGQPLQRPADAVTHSRRC